MTDLLFELLKEEEQSLQSKIPSFLSEQKITSPTKFLSDYQKTGDNVFKKAAGRAYEALKNASSVLSDRAAGVASGAMFIGAMATPQGRKVVAEKVAPKLFNKASKVIQPVFQGFKDISTTVIEKLKSRSNVSKITLSQMLKQADVKPQDVEMIARVLKEESDIIKVPEFADRVKAEILPLKVKGSEKIQKDDRVAGWFPAKYERYTLPSELRGPVHSYQEKIYESPIKTSGSDAHFPRRSGRYFAHTRVEDLANNQTRRVIETQSDLMQKGGLYRDLPDVVDVKVGDNMLTVTRNKDKAFTDMDMAGGFNVDWVGGNGVIISNTKGGGPITKRLAEQAVQKAQSILDGEMKQLEPLGVYEKHWWKRILREEIKDAANAGKTKVQFPDGETAMRIERHFYGEAGMSNWTIIKGGSRVKLQPEDLKVGMMVDEIEGEIGEGVGTNWVVTEVMGDGKFKAVSKSFHDNMHTFPEETFGPQVDRIRQAEETFDLVTRVDKTNPVYKRYEDMGDWLKKNFNAKLVTDENRVTRWYEVDAKSFKDQPVLAHGSAPIKTILGGAAGAASILGATKGMDALFNKPVTWENPRNAESTPLFIKNEPVQGVVNHSKLQKDILYRENRSAMATGENLYEVIGYTGDLGKYQVKPDTLKDWADEWLGRPYTIQEFLHDPQAQEAFFAEFLNVVDRYGLTHNEALVAWHNGWGMLGTGEGTREERKEKYKKQLKKWIETDKEAQDYIKGE